MTTGNTTLLGLALPVEGELDGTWGDVVNDSLTSLVDSAVAGTTTLSADADVTLTDTVLAANQARQAVILWTASNGASTRNITAPARSKPYIVINAGTGSIVLRGAGPTTGVTIIAGEKCLAAWNGSDFVKVSTSTAAAGDVVGPGSATDGNLAAFDGTTGKLIKQAATVTVAQGGTGVTTSTGTGNVVLSNSPTLVTPALGTPASGNLSNATADGTNAVGYRNIPAVADKTTSYSLQTADVGKVVGVGSGGSITIPNATFAAGDAVLVFNNTTGDITITCTITTAYIAGADADVASVTLATRGVCNILFISGTVCVITGNIS
jgi:hypothetical protein